MKCYLFLLVLLWLPWLLYAQNAPGIESGLFRLENGTFNSTQLMIGRKMTPPEVKGNYYLYSAWQNGQFTLKDGRSSEIYPLRYDLENALLEIQWQPTQVKVAGEDVLKSFIWNNEKLGQTQTFILANTFTLNGTPLAAYVEVLHAAADSLLLKTEAYIKKPDYVEGLDMGRRDAEIKKRERYFLCRQSKLYEIKKRKDLLSLVEIQYRKALNKYMKLERLRPDSREELLKIWQYYLELNKSSVF